jgi:hypothetical protein
MMPEWLGRVIDVSELPQVYSEHAGKWLLLEVVERNGNQNPRKLRLVSSESDKEKLHEYLLEDDTWNWSKKYVMILADPEKPCEIK